MTSGTLLHRWLSGEPLLDLLDEQQRDESWPLSQTAAALAESVRKIDSSNDRLVARVLELESERDRFIEEHGPVLLAAYRFVALERRHSRAQAPSAADTNAAASAEAPTRRERLAALRALLEAVPE